MLPETPLSHTHYEVEDSDQLESLTVIPIYPAVKLLVMMTSSPDG